MPREAPDRLLKRAEKAWSNKQNWDDTLKDAYKFTQPQRDIFENPRPGQVKGNELFDSTAIVSSMKFANKFINAMFPPYRRWAKMQAGPGVDEDSRDEVNEKLEAITETAFAIIHNRSQFQTAIGELALDLVIGTGVMTIQKGTPQEPINYFAIPQTQVALEEGPNGTVGGCFRRFELPIRLIQPTWPTADIPERLLAQEADDPAAKVHVDEVTYKDFKTGQWYYDVIASTREDESIKGERMVGLDLKRNPFVTPRFMKAANEVQGRGPTLQALPDIKTLNKLVELILKNATVAVSGPYTVVDDGVINPDTISLKPLSFIPVARNAGHPAGPSIAPLERAGDFQIAFLEYERIQNAIKMVMMDQDLPPLTGQPRTAAEILERVRRLTQDLGATFGRIVQELIVPIMQISLDILEEWGIIDLPVQIDGIGVQLVVTSPLALQQNLDDVESLVRAVEISNALFGPQVTKLAFKVEDIPAWLGNKLGVPGALMRDEDERKELMAKAAQTIAQDAQDGTNKFGALNAASGGQAGASPGSPALVAASGGTP